ncbi:MAG: hypothetical protein GC171_01015 [Terrimonas sp.]|nr:hypothetical protein [Terrimonas sp.]
MKKARLLFTVTIAFSLIVQCADAQKKDTLTISAANLRFDGIKYGKASYLVYNKKTKDSPAEGMYMVNITVAPFRYKQQPAIEISQQWDGRDTIVHRAYTVLNKTDFSTLLHQTSWKVLGYTTTFDFDIRKVSFDGKVADSNKLKIVSDFDASFANYNLNWHSDLFIFTRLPYKANRSFRINFFDPGFGKPTEEIYSVIGSDVLLTTSGKKIICWVMERKGKTTGSYQKFWVDKKSRLVLKEEDLFNSRYRFKLKLEVVENS